MKLSTVCFWIIVLLFAAAIVILASGAANPFEGLATTHQCGAVQQALDGCRP